MHGIVGQHGGYIDVESRVGEGTTVSIYLPALQATPVEALPPDVEGLPEGHNETILVVEDGKMIRTALVDSLAQLHYRIIEASNGQAALTAMEESGAEIALILSDVVMPGMSGIALFHALRERGWSTPVILLTGHPLDKELDTLRDQGLCTWLNKPPTLEDLAEAIHRALA